MVKGTRNGMKKEAEEGFDEMNRGRNDIRRARDKFGGKGSEDGRGEGLGDMVLGKWLWDKNLGALLCRIQHYELKTFTLHLFPYSIAKLSRFDPMHSTALFSKLFSHSFLISELELVQFFP
ncbi:hypothetical protein PoB_000044700 [Plakobranchus ocellatus]|uniref:Uncharacterized protein n=1 Tax=Plakobranchus ocellatus TaxID=259542 RepID=A0AAV3XVS2_9GAST|nr:hypothetical protein PoB_000044700 [Plakobranchus ocellatus]